MIWVAIVTTIMTVIAWFHTITGSIEGGPDNFMAVLFLSFIAFASWSHVLI